MPRERRLRIAELIGTPGSVTVAELEGEFGISPKGVDLIYCHVATYATSLQVLPAVQQAGMLGKVARLLGLEVG